MHFFQVPAERVEWIWPAVNDLIVRACERSSGRFTAEGYKGRISRGEQQLWIAANDDVEAIVVTELSTYLDTGIKSCRVIIGVGRKRSGWLSLASETIEAFSKEQGCSMVEIVARPGWERDLVGYRKTHVFLERDT